jgi:hypothetical protein
VRELWRTELLSSNRGVQQASTSAVYGVSVFQVSRIWILSTRMARSIGLQWKDSTSFRSVAG